MKLPVVFYLVSYVLHTATSWPTSAVYAQPPGYFQGLPALVNDVLFQLRVTEDGPGNLTNQANELMGNLGFFYQECHWAVFLWYESYNTAFFPDDPSTERKRSGAAIRPDLDHCNADPPPDDCLISGGATRYTFQEPPPDGRPLQIMLFFKSIEERPYWGIPGISGRNEIEASARRAITDYVFAAYKVSLEGCASVRRNSQQLPWFLTELAECVLGKMIDEFPTHPPRSILLALSNPRDGGLIDRLGYRANHGGILMPPMIYDLLVSPVDSPYVVHAPSLSMFLQVPKLNDGFDK